MNKTLRLVLQSCLRVAGLLTSAPLAIAAQPAKAAVKRRRAADHRGAGLFLRRRPICDGERWPDHDRPDVRAIPDTCAAQAPLSGRHVARRGPDRHQLSRHARRAHGLGRIFSAPGLCGVCSRPARARAFRLLHRYRYGPTRRPNATTMSERFTAPELAKSLSAGPFTHAMAGQGHRRRSGVQSVLRLAGGGHVEPDCARRIEPQCRHCAAQLE